MSIYTEVHHLARHRHPRAAPGDSHEVTLPSSSCWEKQGLVYNLLQAYYK